MILDFSNGELYFGLDIFDFSGGVFASDEGGVGGGSGGGVLYMGFSDLYE